MTTPDLAALLKIAEAATPGPWHLSGRLGPRDGSEGFYRISAASTLSLEVRPCADGYVPGQNAANAAHIAAFNPTVAQALVEGMKVLGELANRYAGDDGLDRAMKEGIDAEIIGARAALSALTAALKGNPHA